MPSVPLIRPLSLSVVPLLILQTPCFPCRATCSFPLHIPIHFPPDCFQASDTGQDSSCLWVDKTLPRNANRNFLSDVMDGPRPLLVLSISLSPGYTPETKSSLWIAHVSFRTIGLRETQCKHEKGKALRSWQRQALRLGSTLFRVTGEETQLLTYKLSFLENPGSPHLPD